MFELGHIDRIERDEANTVKARQPVMCAYPQVTFRRLSNRRHRTVRQSIVARPNVNHVLTRRSEAINPAKACDQDRKDRNEQQGNKLTAE
jgi:hypothetical protein